MDHAIATENIVSKISWEALFGDDGIFFCVYVGEESDSMHVRTPKERAHEDTTILLAKSVGNKGVLFDARMSMEYHVAQLSKNLGFYLQILPWYAKH